MRIISKYNDYYDCIQSYGHDDSCTFIRKNETVSVCNLTYPSLFKHIEYWMGMTTNSFFNSMGLLSFTPQFLVFCGKLYPTLCISYPLPTSTTDERHVVFTYNRSEFDQALALYKTHYPKSNAVEKTLSRKRYGWGVTVDTNTIDTFFDLSNSLSAYTEAMSLDLGTPLFNIEYKKTFGANSTNQPIEPVAPIDYDVELNPNLSAYGFYTVVDNFTAYTNIRNYIEQRLGGNSPIVATISDLDMVTKKGFDAKMSFRKRPTKNMK